MRAHSRFDQHTVFGTRNPGSYSSLAAIIAPHYNTFNERTIQMSAASTSVTPEPKIVNDRREIIGWTMYDWANSAFSTTVVAALLGPYLTALAQSAVGDNGVVLSLGPLGDVTAKSLFPYSTSLSVFLQVFLLPILGAIADYSHLKKRLMMVFCYLGAAATCLFFFITDG